ncbi:hypothetical protein AB9F45_36645, partial [Rhizobium leguminosarum]
SVFQAPDRTRRNIGELTGAQRVADAVEFHRHLAFNDEQDRFCPQACYAGGPGRFRYLLYKDVNRHMTLW